MRDVVTVRLSLARRKHGFVPNQWETSLKSNAVSHWQGANLESSLWKIPTVSPSWTSYKMFILRVPCRKSIRTLWDVHCVTYIMRRSTVSDLKPWGQTRTLKRFLAENPLAGVLIWSDFSGFNFMLVEVMSWEYLRDYCSFVCGIHQSPRASNKKLWHFICCQPSWYCNGNIFRVTDPLCGEFIQSISNLMYILAG